MPDRITTNKLLQKLSPSAVTSLGQLEHVMLPMRQRIGVHDGDPFVYFLEDGVASVVADIEGKMAVELGIIGNEGFVGTNVVYGDDSDPFVVVMQVGGSAMRADARTVRQAIENNAEVSRLLHLSARAFSIQVGTTALANGRSKLEERLARWLLMVGDRVGTTFSVTHEFISVMLGVRRPGVTLAVQILEGKGLIRAKRGEIALLDRNGLILLANGAYGLAEQHYERLLGSSQ
jgi:CRP-like cAMP-binding protein